MWKWFLVNSDAWALTTLVCNKIQSVRIGKHRLCKHLSFLITCHQQIHNNNGHHHTVKIFYVYILVKISVRMCVRIGCHDDDFIFFSSSYSFFVAAAAAVIITQFTKHRPSILRIVKQFFFLKRLLVGWDSAYLFDHLLQQCFGALRSSICKFCRMI